jgi:hypothetical protein
LGIILRGGEKEIQKVFCLSIFSNSLKHESPTFE